LPEQKNIETGVDKLVEIINKKKKVSLGEAAKELGVSEPIIQEWADFLEDEGLISVQESLSTTYLSERKLTKGEVEKKTKEYSSKKDAFIAKVETALSSLQNESEGLGKIKIEFEKLKDAIGGDIDLVKEELSELRHYEDLKKNIDKEILQQRLDYQSMIDSAKKKISEEKKKYEGLLDSMGVDKSSIEESKVELSFLTKRAENLQKRVEALQDILTSINQDINKQRALITESLDNLQSKTKESEHLRKDMKSRMELEMEPIIHRMKDNEEKVLAVQNAVLQKIMRKHKEINQYKLESSEAADKLRAFFDRRAKISELITSIENEKKGIELELNSLAEKARRFNLSMKSTDTKKFVKELQESLNKVEKKKTGMRTMLESLTEVLKKKE
jgi:chromosome segregation ATPase